MATQPASTNSMIFETLGDFRWVRAHVSTIAVGAVVLVMVDLIIGGPRLWSLTAIGIWSMLLIVHLVLLAIARLSTQLLTDDDEEEIVLLPVQDAVIVDPQPDPTSSWADLESPQSATSDEAQSDEIVSWQIATDFAQARRQKTESESEST